MKLEYIVENEKYTILKDIIEKEFSISRRLVTKLKQKQCFYINGEIAKMMQPIKIGDKIEVLIKEEVETTSSIIATDIPITILEENEQYIIINKQAGITTHPSCTHYDNSLANGIKYYYEQKGIQQKIHPVTRLDKNTSGVILFAKNAYIQESLIKQMKKEQFEKIYIGVVDGILEQEKGIIDMPIRRKENSIIERIVAEDGDIAKTEYNIIKRLEKNTIVQFKLRTGRTHQIRVHCQYMKHPITGDTLYGISSTSIARQALHSYQIQFKNPITKESVNYIAPIPEDMKIFW